jgi:hypothetical protein
MSDNPFPVRLLITGIIVILVMPCSTPAMASTVSGEALLSSVSNSLYHSLDRIDQNLTGIARVFGTSDMKNTSAADIISPYMITREGLAGFLLYTGDTIYPSLHASYLKEPLDPSLLQDSAIRHSITYIKPKMSSIKESGDAQPVIMISRPTVVGDLIGSAIALLVPGPFCEAIIKPRINGTNNMCMVMQPDGKILYTSHPGELTKVPPENFSTLFSTFTDVKTAMSAQKEGHMDYELWRADRSGPNARKAHWNTISLHGTEWRVMVAEPVR